MYVSRSNAAAADLLAYLASRPPAQAAPAEQAAPVARPAQRDSVSISPEAKALLDAEQAAGET